MSDAEKFELCLARAKVITAAYREEYDPLSEVPKCWYVSTTLIVLALVAAAVSAAGAYMSADAQQSAAKYNAAVAKNNAMSAQQQAEFDAQQIRDKNRRVLAQQRTAFAANGIALDSGSTTDISADSAMQGEMQALMAIYTGKTSANAYEAQAKLNNMQASAAQTAGYIGVSSSILGGASSAGMIAANPNFKNS